MEEDYEKLERIEFPPDDVIPYQQLSPRGDDAGGNGFGGPFDYTANGFNPKGVRTRKSKWDPDLNPTMIPGFPRILPQGLQKAQLDALLVRLRIEEITRKLTTGQMDDGPQDRSPSPEPVYDSNGKRVNTRDQRQKEKLNRERQKYVTEAMLMNPLFRPPADYIPPSQKKTRKIYIPRKEYPEYNFIGLIIGPRGNTQKRMERETGSKIAIRGKGSLQEGKLNKQQYQDDDDLHVLITADSEEQLERAAQMVRELLVPVEEGKNEHKKNQLRELALINGTLRDNNTWNISHRTWDAANVKCDICGEVSHPTQDCPSKNGNMPMPAPKTIDSEYESFLAEIGEKKPESASNAAQGGGGGGEDGTDATYEEFMAAISEVAPAKPNAMQGKPPAFAPLPFPAGQQQQFMAPFGRGMMPGFVPAGFVPPQGFMNPMNMNMGMGMNNNFRPQAGFAPNPYGPQGFFPPGAAMGRGAFMPPGAAGAAPGVPGAPGSTPPWASASAAPGVPGAPQQGGQQGGAQPPWAAAAGAGGQQGGAQPPWAAAGAGVSSPTSGNTGAQPPWAAAQQQQQQQGQAQAPAAPGQAPPPWSR